MNIALDGQYAVITGASSGLGYTMAKALLEKGATVALSARPGEKLDNAVETLVQNGLDAYALPMDVCNEDSITEAVSWIREEWKRIDLLVNNAALMMHRIYPGCFQKNCRYQSYRVFSCSQGIHPYDDRTEQGTNCQYLDQLLDHEQVRTLWTLPGGL
jgi:NAD(P)-dependent dehydrogenase (short-subunit alcohol dehydrogenase family)